MKRVHVVYSGQVQGVGFRFTACDIASRYGIKGWVKNCGNGSVELVAEAHDEALKSFLADIKSSLGHHISDQNVSFEPATDEFSGFQVKY